MSGHGPNGFSKSLFTLGQRCHRALWLQKHRPDLQDEVATDLQAVFDSGNEIGVRARDLFPGGLLVPYGEFSVDEQLAMTADAIASGKDTIYEAAFLHEGFFVKVDILHRGGDGWGLYEVKSSAEIKDNYHDDVAVQYFVAARAGLDLVKAALVHVDTGYVRQGEIDVHSLFTEVDLTNDARGRQSTVAENLEILCSMLQGGEPDIDIGPHCDKPNTCFFKGHCWRHIPSPSVFDFRDLGRPDASVLYRSGVVRMEETPPAMLGWRQKLQLDGVLGKKIVVDAVAVRDFIQGLRYPLSFLDFETTYLTAIPLFDGTRPYQQVPFQYSLHVVERPGERPRHVEFLGDPGADPRRAFLDSLLAALPAEGSIVAWNQGFEIARLRELGGHFACSDRIEALVDRFRDLMVPFRRKAIYHRDFEGSYSLKAVLPALIPELTYEGMPIAEGAQASSAWLALWGETNGSRRDEVLGHLQRYCELDTLAMVRILAAMEELCLGGF